MIKRIEAYIVECDGVECNEVLDESGGDYASTSYDTEGKAKEMAGTCGWSVGENKILCPECSGSEKK